MRRHTKLALTLLVALPFGAAAHAACNPPAQDMVRTSLPGEFEHFAAYAGSAAIAPAVADFAASALGALIGGVAVLLLWRYRSALTGSHDAA
jgi:hypothetical protein